MALNIANQDIAKSAGLSFNTNQALSASLLESGLNVKGATMAQKAIIKLLGKQKGGNKNLTKLLSTVKDSNGHTYKAKDFAKLMKTNKNEAMRVFFEAMSKQKSNSLLESIVGDKDLLQIMRLMNQSHFAENLKLGQNRFFGNGTFNRTFNNPSSAYSQRPAGYGGGRNLNPMADGGSGGYGGGRSFRSANDNGRGDPMPSLLAPQTQTALNAFNAGVGAVGAASSVAGLMALTPALAIVAPWAIGAALLVTFAVQWGTADSYSVQDRIIMGKQNNFNIQLARRDKNAARLVNSMTKMERYVYVDNLNEKIKEKIDDLKQYKTKFAHVEPHEDDSRGLDFGAMAHYDDPFFKTINKNTIYLICVPF